MRRRRALSLMEVLVVTSIIGLLFSLLLPALQSARESARRMQCGSRLRQIALAIHHYEAVERAYPPAAVNWSTAGHPNHSCVAFLLPYLEQGSLAGLYRMNVAWNHPDNQAAIRTDLAVVKCPSAAHVVPYTTDYFACTQFFQNGAAQKACQARGIKPRSWEGFLQQQTKAQYRATIRRTSIRDGLSNTWLYFEDAGRPAHYNRARKRLGTFNPASPNGHWADAQGYFNVHNYCGPLQMMNCGNQDEIYSFHPGGCNFAFGDGAVRFESQQIAPELFVSLFTRAGGDIVRRD